MDTLNNTTWDVVIDGTGLPQSLLALALSRYGKKILHLDCNEYYGGREAALSLNEAEEWAKKFEADEGRRFAHARVTRSDTARPAASRAYTLTLSPRLIYGRSNLLQALVSSHTHEQLDFQAMGSFWVVEQAADNSASFLRVPSGREDIFQDKAINLRAKRSLMNFIRAVTGANMSATGAEASPEEDRSLDGLPFPTVLEDKFKLPAASHLPLLALTLSPQAAHQTTYKAAVDGIKRHFQSMGMFGSGFGAVMPKYGGLSEVIQVACRAGAVGGGIYVLGKRITTVNEIDSEEEQRLKLELDGGDTISTRWLARLEDHVGTTSSTWAKSISVVSSPLARLFPPTSAEGGVTPAGAVVVVRSSNQNETPVHIMVHSNISGECPQGQCVLYASLLSVSEDDDSAQRLEAAVEALLRSLQAMITEDDGGPASAPKPEVLWRLSWAERFPAATVSSFASRDSSGIVALPALSANIALEDEVLENVKQAWLKITGEDDEKKFLKFAVRESEDEGGDELYS